MSSGGLCNFSSGSHEWSAEQHCYTLKTKSSLTVKINLLLNFNLEKFNLFMFSPFGKSFFLSCRVGLKDRYHFIVCTVNVMLASSWLA